jgi:uncharacterized protein (TIGR02145 family)
MAENLAYLPSVSHYSSGSDTIPHYYVYDYQGISVAEARTTTNYELYGVLYNWISAVSGNQDRDICPAGWHLPSDDEWKTLEISLGMNMSEVSDFGARNSGQVGIKMKANSGWRINGSGDNSSGFNALPSGYRDLTGSFVELGYSAYFWSSSLYGASSALPRLLLYDEDGVFRGYSLRRYGFSIRCISN